MTPNPEIARPASESAEATRRETAIDHVEATPFGAQEMAAARLAVDVHANLLKALAASGLSQRELAERLGATEGRVSQVVNSDGNLRISTIAKYLRALGYHTRLRVDPADASTPSLSHSASRRRHSNRPSVWQMVETPAGGKWAVRAQVTQPQPGYLELTATALELHAETEVGSRVVAIGEHPR